MPIKWIRLIAIALLILGTAFRFAHLDRKVYWHDEAYTSMVITARPGRYLSQDLFQNRVVKPADLLAYQDFVPDLTLKDMVVRKGIEDVQHPPLYYVLLRFWAQVWGTAPVVTRGFSSLLSLLVFPALYGLCRELFALPLSGWVAIALFAVSPLHLVFGQEAREFGFWTALILASSALLLRAMDRPSWRNWVLYGVSMVAAAYTALFSVCIAIGHFAYVLGTDAGNQLGRSPRVGKRTIFCFGTLCWVAVFFLPWVYFIVAAHQELGGTTSWTAVPLTLLVGVQASVFNFSRSFVDFNFGLDAAIAYLLALPILALQGYALYQLCRTAPRKTGWFMVTFMGVTALFFGLPDLLSGGQRFTVTRYLIPCFVGLQLAVVYLLSSNFTARPSWKRRFATLVFSLLIALGVLSCGVYAQANTWWNKGLSSNYHQVAELINGAEAPLIVTDAFSYNPASMISLSYLLEPETQFLLLPRVEESFSVTDLPRDAKTIFLFNLPGIFREQFEVRYPITFSLAFQDPWNEVWESDVPSSLQSRQD
ncbi:MAG: glycosyltransferase family 39 protein [Cyanobacteria bacterium]|nr:glycosyltransferase family 39 protein [Cyanobacteriota bacterium]MDA0865407.1 glycosyltransferase family 39 protein [Cyanobacteriota bacterium]